MNEQCSKAKLLGSNGLKELDLFSSSQFHTTLTLTPCVNNDVASTILNQFINHSFNFIQSKQKALFLGSMPDVEEEHNNNNSYSSNEDSGYIYYPCSPILRFKENKFEVSDFSLR